MYRLPIEVISLNMEVGAYLSEVKEFIRNHQPDVLCLQEMPPQVEEEFRHLIGGARQSAYVVVNRHRNRPAMGIGIISRLPLQKVRICGYTGEPHSRETRSDAINEMMIFATVRNGSAHYRIGTTHMRVTKEGRATPAQMRSVRDLLDVAADEAMNHEGLLLTGDFNAPRGRPAFDAIAKVLEDGVPAHYTQSLDPAHHRIYEPGRYQTPHKLNRMVDGLFHTKNYGLTGVQLHTGVSDHCALTGTLYQR